MAKGELYNIIYDPSADSSAEIKTYMVMKFDGKTLSEKEPSYKVRRGPGIFGGTCWAGTKPTCRHRVMVEVFIDNQAINSSRLFDYDNNRWAGELPVIGGDDDGL